MKSYYNLDSQWFLIKNEIKYGPMNIRKIITLYYEGKVRGTELCLSLDGKVNSYANNILQQVKK